jgi:hypothetical protein
MKTKKKVLIGIGIFIILVIAAMAYLNHRNRTLSPPGKVVFKQGDLNMVINYSRPSVRDRLIFGTESEDALQPYGVYWRLGANEGTEITINQDVFVEGKPLLAGTYRLYGYPDADSFEMVVSSATGDWGYSEPDPTEDLFRITLPVNRDLPPVEQYTVGIHEMDSTTIINFAFSDYQFNLNVAY